MNETRRGFLGLLAKLPGLAFLSAWMARPVDAKSPDQIEFEGRVYRPYRIGGWNSNPLVQSIRWIPATERLPNPDFVSRRFGMVLFVDSGRVTIGQVWRHSETHEAICEDHMQRRLMNVTHWAELPAPPEPVQ